MMYYKGKYIVRGRNYYTFKLAARDILLNRIIQLGLDIDTIIKVNNIVDYLAIKNFFMLNNKKILEPKYFTIPCMLSFNNVSKNIVELKCE